MDNYVQWLKRRDDPIFESAGTYWRTYQNALVPASIKPRPLELTTDQARQLLDESGARFLRYFSQVSERPTDFWYTACSEYNFKKIPQKLRTQVRRAYKECRVDRVDASWLSANGYSCYTAAFARYRNAQPESRAAFDDMCLGAKDGPFEFWGVFVGDKLVGFNKYVIEADYAAGVVLKLDPAYFSLNPASALEDAVLNTYVAQQGKTVSVGFRPVLHETNMHQFLQKFGYRKIYCDLKLVYRPSVSAAVRVFYPLRSFVDRIPDSGWSSKVRALFAQEQIRRSFDPNKNHTKQWREPILSRIVRSIWGNTTERR